MSAPTPEGHLAQAYDFIEAHRLEPHPEGGFYRVTFVSESEVSSPFAKDNAKRPLCSTIFYLLAPRSLTAQDVKKHSGKPELEIPKKHRSHSGYFHTNASTTSHTWHSGRATYTLIKKAADASGAASKGKGKAGEVEIKTIVMGPDASKGEQLCLVVEGGWWKRSEVLDLNGQGHCLISECVVPAWVPEDHEFMTRRHLEELFGEDKRDLVERYAEHVLDDGPIFG